MVAIGADLGGTHIRAALVTPEGEVLASKRIPTEAAEGGKAVLGRLIELLRQVRREAEDPEIVGIGIGSAGTIGGSPPVRQLADSARRSMGATARERPLGRGPTSDFERGVVLAATQNLPGWRGIAVAESVAGALGLPAWVDNDANVGALGEKHFGAARGFSDFIYLTFGTGIGGCVFANGRIVRGARQAGGDIGHVIVEPGGRLCTCGRAGCFEAYASARAVIDRARAAVRAGYESSLRGRLGAEPSAEDLQTIFQTAQEGDELAAQIVKETAQVIGRTLVSVNQVTDPEAFVLGGGLIETHPRFVEHIAREVSAAYAPRPFDPPAVVAAALGAHAGVVGGAALAFLSSGKGLRGKRRMEN